MLPATELTITKLAGGCRDYISCIPIISLIGRSNRLRQLYPFRSINCGFFSDCTAKNIMMDPLPLYPNLYHPVETRRTRDYTGIVKPLSRTEHPTRYYLIDFGLSRRYQPEDLPALEDIIMPGDKTVPEYQGDAEACDPFPADVYLIGNMIREKFLRVSSSTLSVSDELTNIHS